MLVILMASITCAPPFVAKSILSISFGLTFINIWKATRKDNLGMKIAKKKKLDRKIYVRKDDLKRNYMISKRKKKALRN